MSNNNVGVYNFVYQPTTADTMGKGTSQGNSKNNPASSNQFINTRKRSQNAMNSEENVTNGGSQDQPESSKRSKTSDCKCQQCDNVKHKLDEISSNLAKLDSLDRIEATLMQITNSLAATNGSVVQLQSEVETIKEDLSNVQQQIVDFRSEKTKMETEMKKINLIVSGIRDEDEESEQQLATKIQNEISKINNGRQRFNFDTISRFGRYKPGKTRNVHIRFLSMRDRNEFFELRKSVRNPVFINADVPEEVRKAEFLMRQKIRFLKNSENVLNIVWKNFEIETNLANYRLGNDGSFSRQIKLTDNSMDSNI